ncbi:hypothetical protein [Rufibacter tibetensis]|uniref:Lipoprotein n=1 Tax=Rufibacter tibetensis TaxID=512763 RepID=A0A0P0CZ27_9BACT|nr:hypothetical protein [Rufibacter tibetensis]ALJ00739.1 hypothetical protein DC20_19335 [Rufibacter tibetensis]
MTKKLFIGAFCFFWIGSCTQEQERKDYEVQENELANFSVISPELYPEERLEVKLNGELVVETGINTSWTHSFWKHFYYPDSIKLIEVSIYYKGEKKLEKVYRDTLMTSNSRSIIVSRTFPKGITKENYKQHGFVPMDSADRKITLVDDSVHYKNTWVY